VHIGAVIHYAVLTNWDKLLTEQSVRS